MWNGNVTVLFLTAYVGAGWRAPAQGQRRPLDNNWRYRGQTCWEFASKWSLIVNWHAIPNEAHQVNSWVIHSAVVAVEAVSNHWWELVSTVALFSHDKVHLLHTKYWQVTVNRLKLTQTPNMQRNSWHVRWWWNLTGRFLSWHASLALGSTTASPPSPVRRLSPFSYSLVLVKMWFLNNFSTRISSRPLCWWIHHRDTHIVF